MKLPDIHQATDKMGEHWVVTNNTEIMYEADVLTLSGTCVTVPLTPGASFRFYSTNKDDANLRVRPLPSHPRPALALVRPSEEGESDGK